MTQRTFIWSALCLIFAGLLSGCVSLKLNANDSHHFQKRSPSTRLAELAKVNAWDITGAFSFMSQGKVNLANYTWQEKNPKNYIITIDSALHVYSVTIEGTAQGVTLTESDKKGMTAATAEALLEKRLHTRLPIQALRFWIRGLAAPGPYQASYDAFGHLEMLHQAGWQVALSHYTTVKHLDLPQMLMIHGEHQQIKIVIKSWSL